MDLKNAPLHILREDRDAYHQRQSPAFPHTLFPAYLCHDDISIPSYSIIHIVPSRKLYLHDKLLPRAHPLPHTPRPIQQHSSLYNFSTIIFPYKKRCTKRCAGRRCKRTCATRCARRCQLKMNHRRMPLFSAVGVLDEATLLNCTHWLKDMATDHLLTAIYVQFFGHCYLDHEVRSRPRQRQRRDYRTSCRSLPFLWTYFPSPFPAWRCPDC